MKTKILKAIAIAIAVRVLFAVLVWWIGRWLARRSKSWLTQLQKRTARAGAL